MFKIGDITFPSSTVLAPLAGISDLPFRMINRSLGCDFAFVEMTSANAIVYQNKKTEVMLTTTPEDRPLGVQLVGSDPEIIKRALGEIEQKQFEIIDFNAACPVRKVTRKGEGASLLREPRKLRDLLRVIVGSSAVPVTVKIRAGWNALSINAREVALHAQDSGISALFIHGRSSVQGYKGRVDYEIIREVKEALAIPVIGSGDVLSPQLARRMLDETGCDGVVIARGSFGNPWIFRETAEYLRSGTIPERPGIDEIAAVMTAHLGMCCDLYGDRGGAASFRKFFGWYTKGLHAIRPLRGRAFRAQSGGEVADIIREMRTGG
ncbi:MAG: tRNA dihydrouridine synthase DusB [Deltaproteobacteria bacterium]|nr:tRNA dihydrouridine synthase DusB [Deltaproteobacteria bacterium]